MLVYNNKKKAEWREKRHTCDPEFKKNCVFRFYRVFGGYTRIVYKYTFTRNFIVVNIWRGRSRIHAAVVDRNRKTVIVFRPYILYYTCSFINTLSIHNITFIRSCL